MSRKGYYMEHREETIARVMKNQQNLSEEKKRHLNAIKREYQRNRYRNDEEYAERQRKYCREYYHRKKAIREKQEQDYQEK